MVAGHLQVKKGYYYAVLSYYDGNKKRCVKYISTGLKEKGNKRNAEKMLREIQSNFEIPREVGDLRSDMLFADYLLQWLLIKKTQVRTTTYRSYEGIIRNKIEPYFRRIGVTLCDLQAFQVQHFYTDQLEKVKSNTVIRYHAIIHNALKYAVKTDLISQNIADKVDRPKKNAYEASFLLQEELDELFDAIKGTKFELPVLVAAFYGLRRGEVLGLKWDAIDFERGTLTIKRTVIAVVENGQTIIKIEDAVKTKSSMRTMPLIPSFREYFLRVKETQKKNKEFCGNCYNYEYDGFVFVDEMGNLIKPGYLTSEFPKFLEKHGLKRIRFHDLRHSCASLLLANGVAMKQIQEWLGHSDFSTTANIYAHLDYSSKIASANVMADGIALPDAADFDSKW